MKPRSLAAVVLLLLCSSSWAQGTPPKAWQPKGAVPRPTTPAAPANPAPAPQLPRVGKDGRPIKIYDGVPDTGQFLPDTTIIGRIDERVFRVHEFRERWFASYMLDRPKPDSAGRLQFLNSMVNKEVLAALARDVNRPLTFEDRSSLRETQERLLSNVVFARLIADSSHWTMDEVRHVYEQGNYRLHVQHIVVDHPAVAEQARADVAGKRMDWTQAVRQYSNGRGDQGPDGDLGWVQRTFFDPAPALEIFDLPDGGVSSVFRSDNGWEFVRVIERRPEKQPTIETLGKLLSQEVLAVKVSRRTEQVRVQIRERIGMVYDTTNIAWASSLFRDTERQTQGTGDKPVIDMSGMVPEFQAGDTSRVLARWKDGQFTLGGFMVEFQEIPVPQREKIGSFTAFRSALDRFVLEPFMAQLAAERGLDRDSLVVTGMARREEQIRVEHLFADSIEARLSVTSQEREKYYRDHLPDYYGLQSVTYAGIMRHTKAGADSVEARLKAGETAASILLADSLAGLHSGGIRTMREDEHGTYQKPLFEELKPGGVLRVGPDKAGDYLVMQKLAHDPGHQLSFREVATVVDESVQNIKAEKMLQRFMARHRSKHRVTLHPELLMRILLTDPTIDG
jgi:parvulin-like peptidyl-prolyl isomerase